MSEISSAASGSIVSERKANKQNKRAVRRKKKLKQVERNMTYHSPFLSIYPVIY